MFSRDLAYQAFDFDFTKHCFYYFSKTLCGLNNTKTVEMYLNMSTIQLTVSLNN